MAHIRYVPDDEIAEHDRVPDTDDVERKIGVGAHGCSQSADGPANPTARSGLERRRGGLRLRLAQAA